MKFIQNSSAPIVRSATPLSSDIGASLTLQSLFIPTSPGTSTLSTDNDAIINTVVNPTGYEEGTLLAVSSFLGASTYVSKDPLIATIDSATGKISRVSQGTARIIARLPSEVNIRLDVDLRNTEQSEVVTLSEWINGSLAKELAAGVDNRINGLTASISTKRIYNTSDLSPTSFNASCWANDLNFSGCAFNLPQAGTAITRRHVLLSAHSLYGVGTNLKFMLPDGSIVNRTVIGFAYFSDAGTAGQTGTWSKLRDWCVAVLDSDLPTEIPNYKIAPSNIMDYLANLQYGIPLICLDVQNHATICEWFSNSFPITNEENNGDERALFRAGKNERADWYEALGIGDSGDPSFLVLDGELILFACHTYSTSCLPYFHDIEGLQELILEADSHASVSTGYTPDIVDLTPYTNFATPNPNAGIYALTVDGYAVTFDGTLLTL